MINRCRCGCKKKVLFCWMREAISLGPVPLAPDYWRVALGKSHLPDCLSEQKKSCDAKPLLDEGYSVVKKQFGPRDPQTREAGMPLIDFYEKLGKKDKAAGIRADLWLPE
jgi:hypothetical protein